MNVLHYKHCKPPTCTRFGCLLWPSSWRHYVKDLLQRHQKPMHRNKILSCKMFYLHTESSMYGHGLFKIKKMPNRQRLYMPIRTQRRITRNDVAIWFNKMCGSKHLTPSYIKITTISHNKQGHNNIKAAIIYRINQELTFLLINSVQYLLIQQHTTGMVIQYTTAHGTLVTHLNLAQIIYLHFIF